MQRDVVEAVAVHDDAMLARVATVLALHSVGSFSYVPTGDRAVVRLEVLGGDAQTTRVLHRLRRLVGVVHAGCEDTRRQGYLAGRDERIASSAET